MSGDERLQELWRERTELSLPVLASGFKPDEVSVGEAAQEAKEHDSPPKYEGSLDGVRVRVYLTVKKKVETVPLESYVLGVLAGEMPAHFHVEALKAQAVAARTYIVRRLSANAGAEHKADVLDSIQHQVYLSKDELSKRWKGKAGEEALSKLRKAVEETRGLVVTYDGEPIEAAFFSTSNGYTENSEDYWGQPIPYLRSVASPWDKALSPRYEAEISFKKTKLYRALGITGKAAQAKLVMKVMERTDGKRIQELDINGKRFSGKEVREKLGLASSHFDWKIEEDTVTITTYGFGHGVGMSQWGANGMAQEGKNAADILLHYYSGARLEQASKLPSRTTS